jgi:hypothetical protein
VFRTRPPGWASAANRAHTTSGVGVYGLTTNPAGFGVYSLGRFGASGTKLFQIDHPMDPANKYLNHYCTESPEVLNAYRGTVTLDPSGSAWVQLPPYFARINKEPSYTLTAVGAAMPLLHIGQEIDERTLAEGAAAAPADVVPACSFRIAGGAPGARCRGAWRQCATTGGCKRTGPRRNRKARS